MSWEVLFAGYCTFPSPDRVRPSAPVVDLPKTDAFLDACLLNFPKTA